MTSATGSEFATGARAALIAAHPGHELLLHHWIERARPLVFILTDGSGGAARDRHAYSRLLVESCGARCGSVFGLAADKTWYRAMLDRDATLFNEAVAAMLAQCRRENVTHIVCDPVELFNPMHDLANAAAHAVAKALSPFAEAVPVLTYPIEQERAHDPAWRLSLDAEAMARKLEAVKAYTPLAHELAHYEQLIARGHELILPDAPVFGWPALLDQEPFYESFGRWRLREKRYRELITYAGHVRPIAVETLGLRAAA